MKKLLIALLATAPLFATAEAWYNVYLNNQTNKDITLIYEDDSCMHGRGPSKILIPAHSKYPPFNLLDSNAAFTCNNSEKSVTWYIEGYPKEKRAIKFRHFIVHTGIFSNQWVTRIENNGTLHATCDRWYTCNNTDYASDAKVTRISLRFSPQ